VGGIKNIYAVGNFMVRKPTNFGYNLINGFIKLNFEKIWGMGKRGAEN